VNAGQSQIYYRVADVRFLLYSVGGKVKEDGGQDSPHNQNCGVDYTKGDWFWKN
jgi:hypothetical protein